jgi:hypothetical protein
MRKTDTYCPGKNQQSIPRTILNPDCSEIKYQRAYNPYVQFKNYN